MRFEIELDSGDILELFQHIQKVLAYQDAEFVDPDPVDYVLMGVLAQIFEQRHGKGRDNHGSDSL